MKLEEAKSVADELIGLIRDDCYTLELVGSIRREKENVNDIDIVVVLNTNVTPKSLAAKLFGKVNTIMSGDKIWRFEYRGKQFDIYFATPQTFETLVLIRTGSAEHNIKLCTEAKNRGWKLKASGEGLLNEKGELLDNTEYGILVKLLGHYLEPKDREVVRDG